jgi:hypothetical protein
MDFNLTVPSLIFSSISLFMLAFTNRFLALASLVRSMEATYRAQPDPRVLRQIANFRRRIRLIRAMQALGISALMAAVASMLLLFLDAAVPAQWAFAASLMLMIASLLVSFWEILISTRALELQLAGLEELLEQADPPLIHLPVPFQKPKPSEPAS